MPLKFASPSRSWPISMAGWCCLILVYLQLVRATDVSFTIEVAAGSRDCFHQSLTKDVQYESEYQVWQRTRLIQLYKILVQISLVGSSMA